MIIQIHVDKMPADEITEFINNILHNLSYKDKMRVLKRCLYNTCAERGDEHMGRSWVVPPEQDSIVKDMCNDIQEVMWLLHKRYDLKFEANEF